MSVMLHGDSMSCTSLHDCSVPGYCSANQASWIADIAESCQQPVLMHCSRVKPAACCMQSRYRRIRQWQVMYAVQTLGDKWRSLERRKDRQRQAYESAISNAADLDLQQKLQEAADLVDQVTSIEVSSTSHVHILLALCSCTLGLLLARNTTSCSFSLCVIAQKYILSALGSMY